MIVPSPSAIRHVMPSCGGGVAAIVPSAITVQPRAGSGLGCSPDRRHTHYAPISPTSASAAA